MDIQIDELIKITLGKKVLNNKILTTEEKEKIRYTLMTWVYSHRSTKDDLYINEIEKYGIDLRPDFDLIRFAQYKYSQKVLCDLISESIHCFLFIKFANNPENKTILTKKNKNNKVSMMIDMIKGRCVESL